MLNNKQMGARKTQTPNASLSHTETHIITISVNLGFRAWEE
jgi:hypothetical protein